MHEEIPLVASNKTKTKSFWEFDSVRMLCTFVVWPTSTLLNIHIACFTPVRPSAPHKHDF